MANIAITNFCNLRCPYCFANSYIEESTKQNITMEQLDFILAFLGRSQIGRVGIIGGEPTLHPSYNEIIARVSDFAVRHDTHCITFTNGLLISEHIKQVGASSRLLINVNPPSVMGTQNWDRLIYGMKLLQVAGKLQYTNVGVNLYPGIPETDFIFDLLQRFRLVNVRMSYVAPTCQFSGSDKESYYEFARGQFLPFVKRAKELQIQVRLDCNHIPDCYFTEKELEDMKGTVTGGMSFCTPVVDITPDFHATACFGAYDLVDLSPFATLQDAERYFLFEKMLPRSRANANGRCESCQKHRLDICQGGCLVFGAEKEGV